MALKLPSKQPPFPPQNCFHLRIFKYSKFISQKNKKSNFLLPLFYIIQFSPMQKLELQFAWSSMAQLPSPSPVFTEALKLQNPLPNGCSRTPWRMLAKPSSSLTSMGGLGGGGRRRRGLGRLRVATDGSPSTDAVADDYYSVLGLV